MATSDSTSKTIEIPLTHGFIAIVDTVDADLAELSWYAKERKAENAYAIRGARNRIYIHRVILSRMLGRELEKHEICDHINRIPNDNRRSNLRLATVTKNAQNRKVRIQSTTGFKGVYPRKDGSYSARITVAGKTRRIGQRYATPEEAYVIYCQAAREHFGEFAHLPDEDKVAGIVPVSLTKPHKRWKY